MISTDYKRFLSYLDDEIINEFNYIIKSKVTTERYNQIILELSVYFDYFMTMKIKNPDKIIDDHVGAILYSYAIDPNLNIFYRDAHYNGIWYSLIGNLNGEKKEDIINKCSSLNQSDRKWTEVCLIAVKEYFEVENKMNNKLSNWIKKNVFKKN